MSFVLNAVYLSLLAIGSPWLLWRYVRWGKNRRGWTQKLFGRTPIRIGDRPCIWFHAVSVGEVNLLDQVLQRLKVERPDVEVLVSTTTETGFDLARSKHPNLTVFFFPFDFSWAIKTALRRIRPTLIVLSELELWPNFIRLANQFPAAKGCRAGNGKSGTPIVVVNGRLSATSFRGYRRLGFLMRSTFRRLNLVMAQNETYANRFKALGCPESRVLVTGSVKFDGLQTDRKNQKTQELANLAGLQSDDFVFVAGSTQIEEDVLAAKAFQQLLDRFPQLKLVLVPRHPERVPQLVRELDQLGLASRRRSQLTATGSLSSGQNNLLIVDVIGELGAWWGVADATYVGGSMGSRGGQNMIEPAAYGIPVAFGPHTENFQDIVDQLLDADAATVVHDLTELIGYLEHSINDAEWASEIGARAQAVVLQHDGASQRTVNSICDILNTSPQNGQRWAA